MRKPLFSIMSATFIVAMVMLPGLAVATNTSMAIAICVYRGPDCSLERKSDHYQLSVNNTGGKEWVNCPLLTDSNQTCTVAKKKPGTKPSRGVVTVLAGEDKMESKE